MTVLSAAQSAAIRLVGDKPTSLFSPVGSNARFANELADLATDVAVDIAKQRDWRALTKLATVTGDGLSLGFPLPSDYDRMPVKAAVHSGSWAQWRFEPARDLDQWLDILTFAGSGLPGWWIILDGQIQLTTGNSVPLGAGTIAKFYYISNQIAAGKAAFSDDGDVFALSDRLLTLGLVWRWRQQKRQEYGEDLKNYELALEKEIARDKGAQLLTSGVGRLHGQVRTAYPGALG